MMNITEICGNFIDKTIISATPFGDGHINDSFLIKTDGNMYICQRVQKKMDTSVLTKNYGLYSTACDNFSFRYPTWIKTRENGFFFTDETGDHWRMYPYIPGEVLSAPLSERELYACGRGLAKLHLILDTVKEPPEAVYPMLHDLKYYWERYEALFEGPDLIAENRDLNIEKIISTNIDRFLAVSNDRTAVIHGDAKLANILFKDGEVIAFIDIDTVMRGSRAEDLADLIRSACTGNGGVDLKSADNIIKGYVDTAPGLLSSREISLIPETVKKIGFELALRYYTDSISKVKLFKENYPGYLLEKAEKQLLIIGQ